jgi:hypothetical protein
VVVGDAGEIGDQAGSVAVGGVFGLRVVVVAFRVPAADVVGVAVAVVVEAAAGGTLPEFVAGDATVAEDRDQVLRRQIPSRGAADVDLVDVLMFAAGDAAARRPVLELRKSDGAGWARRVDARVLGIVADVEVTVVVEVVGAAALSVWTLGVGKLPFVQVDVVQRILDPVVRVVDPAFDVGDADVGPAEGALGPGAGDVDARAWSGSRASNAQQGRPPSGCGRSATVPPGATQVLPFNGPKRFHCSLSPQPVTGSCDSHGANPGSLGNSDGDIAGPRWIGGAEAVAPGAQNASIRQANAAPAAIAPSDLPLTAGSPPRWDRAKG